MGESDRMISFEKLRARIQSGAEYLLTLLPEGVGLVLDCEYRDTAGNLTKEYVPDGLAQDILLLRDFSSMVEALLATGLSPGRVREILDQEGGAQAILLEDTDALTQEYLD